MNDMLTATPAGPGVEIHGPFLPEYRVTNGGYHVPHLTVQPLDDGRIAVTIDGRFGLADPVTRDEFNNWLPILANAMAVAAGYACHGSGAPRLNPFNVRMSSLGSVPDKPNLTVIDGDK